MRIPVQYLRLLAPILLLASYDATASVTKVVAVGDPAPGVGTFASYAGYSPFLLGENDRGDVLFWSGVADGFYVAGVFLFESDEGTIIQIVSEGQIAPDMGGGTFVNLFPSTDNFRLNNRRQIAFAAQIQNGTSDSGVFFCTFAGSLIRKIAAGGDRAPLPALIEPTDEPDIFVPSFGSVDLNEHGDVFFVGLQGKRIGKSYVSRGGVYLWTDGSPIDRWVTSGVSSEVGMLDISPGSVLGPVANINQVFLLWATTSQPTQGVFSCIDGSCHKVVAVGDPIPGGSWPTYSGPCCIVGFNDSGLVGLQGLSPRGEILLWSGGIFLADIGPGYAVPDLGTTLDSLFVRSGDIRPINNSGQMTFAGATADGPPTAPGVFLFSSDGTLTKPVAAGDTAPPDQGVFTAFGRTTINTQGRIAFEANTSAPLGYNTSIWQTNFP